MIISNSIMILKATLLLGKLSKRPLDFNNCSKFTNLYLTSDSAPIDDFKRPKCNFNYGYITFWTS